MLGKVSAFSLPVVTPPSLLEKRPPSSGCAEFRCPWNIFSEPRAREGEDQWLWVGDPAEHSVSWRFEKLPRPSRCRGERAQLHPRGASTKPARRRGRVAMAAGGGAELRRAQVAGRQKGAGEGTRNLGGASFQDGATSLMFLLTLVALDR